MKKNILLGSISVTHYNWLPYAAGCLISYCQRIPEINEQYHFLEPIFLATDPEDYRKIFEKTDILGLTCYVWNQSYNDDLSQFYKEVNPNGIVVYGGPNIPENNEQKRIFDAERDWVYESIAGLGEIAFSEWLLGLEYSNTVLKDLPTPYLDGIFDNMLTTGKKFKVSFETNRGCPYSCSFCDWGGQAKSKITKFDLDKIKETIDYIYKFEYVSELEILDANFGIFERDIEIIDYMIDAQKRYNNDLRISYSGLAKNGSKHLIEIMSKIHNNLPINQRNLKISFQTHTKDVLKAIDRDNIKNDKLIPLIQEFQKNNIPTTSEMIICLPSETAESWLDTMHYNYHDLNIDFLRAYILHVVVNTPLYNQVLRGEFRTKKIIYSKSVVDVLIQDIEQTKLMFSYFWIFNTFFNTKLSKTDNLKETVLLIYNNLNEMPFIKSLLDKYLKMVVKVFGDEPETVLDEHAEVRFFVGSLRGEELQEMIDNQSIVQNELEKYIDLPQCQWNFDNPIGAITELCETTTS